MMQYVNKRGGKKEKGDRKVLFWVDVKTKPRMYNIWRDNNYGDVDVLNEYSPIIAIITKYE